jgi:hypothetical protein
VSDEAAFNALMEAIEREESCTPYSYDAARASLRHPALWLAAAVEAGALVECEDETWTCPAWRLP